MTIHELSKYYYLKQQIESIKLQINEINNTILGSVAITDMPTNSQSVSSPVELIISKKEKLERKMNRKIFDLLKQVKIIEDFIDTIDDERVKVIIRYRFIELKSWEEIGNLLHFDRTTPYYILKKYLDERINYEKEVEKTL